MSICRLFVSVVVCSDGTWFKYLFDPEKGGECKQETYGKFFEKEATPQ